MSKDIKNNSKKPILLCILDGWGIGKEDPKSNAIFKANTPNYDSIISKYPYSKLGTSGLDVGLPDGQIGNSEVGHVTIGSGRVIYQDLPRINKSIEDNELENNEHLQSLIKNCKENNKACHLIGLLSDGGVHSHQSHITYLAKAVAKNNIEVKIHAFLDGRDVEQKSAVNDIAKFEKNVKEFSNIKIATISGRYFAMDRDNKWDRIEESYNAIVKNKGNRSKNSAAAIKESYNNNITDEFLQPTIIGDYQGIENGDALLSANFRADRIRQISHSLIDNNFKEFETKNIDFCSKVSMTQYSDILDKYYDVLFPSIEIKNSLGELLEKNNLTQLRVAETEKYAHVTFFFSGGQEKEFKGEDRILIKSPDVKTYDLDPKMSAMEVGNNLKDAIKSDKYDFIVVNYANPDMVGHSGVFDAAVSACEVIDGQLGILKDAVLKQDGVMLVTADHGNIENMITQNNTPHTAHTTNPVPFIFIGNDTSNIKIQNGTLADITPSILHLMNIKQPKEVKGNNLIS